MAEERKVRFYRAVDENFNRVEGGFDRERVMELVRGLEAVRVEAVAAGRTDGVPGEVSIDLGRRHLIAGELPSPGQSAGLFLVLHLVSTGDLPMLYEHGRIRPLTEVLGDDAATGLAEPAYFGLYPDDIVVMLYNHKGPKTSQLQTFLMNICGLECVFSPILRSDVADSVSSAGGVKLLRIRAMMNEATGLQLSSMARLADDNQVTDVEVILRARGTQRVNLRPRVEQLIRWLDASGARGIKAAKVELSDPNDSLSEGRALDLIEDALALSEPVALIGQGRFVAPESAVTAIDEAYRKMQPRLDI